MGSKTFAGIVGGMALTALVAGGAVKGCNTEAGEVDRAETEEIDNTRTNVSTRTSSATQGAGVLGNRSEFCRSVANDIYNVAQELGTHENPKIIRFTSVMTEACMQALSGGIVNPPTAAPTTLPRTCYVLVDRLLGVLGRSGLASRDIDQTRNALLTICAVEGEGVLYTTNDGNSADNGSGSDEILIETLN